MPTDTEGFAARNLGGLPDVSQSFGSDGDPKADRPVYLEKASHAVIAKRTQIDESTRIPRAIAQLPWCNR
jgi:hypothetical protein